MVDQEKVTRRKGMMSESSAERVATKVCGGD